MWLKKQIKKELKKRLKDLWADDIAEGKKHLHQLRVSKLLNIDHSITFDHNYITLHWSSLHYGTLHWSLHYNWKLTIITLHYIDHHYNSLIIITIQNVTITSRVLHLFFSNGLRQIPEKKKLFFFQGFPKYHWKCNLFVNVPFISNKWLGQIPKTSWLINAKGNIWIVNFLLQHSNGFWAGGIAWCIIIMTMFLRLVIIMTMIMYLGQMVDE